MCRVYMTNTICTSLTFYITQRETPAAAGKEEEEEEEGKKEKGDGAKENGVDEKEVMEQNKKFLRNLSSHEVCPSLTFSTHLE